MDKKTEALKQEPVAWMIWTHGPVLVFMNKDEANLEFDRLNHTYPEPARILVPLYTSPPFLSLAQRQRSVKPLTNEEIENVWERVQANDFHDCVQPFARAIEAAHGIKGNA